jgi:hypothetical protein
VLRSQHGQEGQECQEFGIDNAGIVGGERRSKNWVETAATWAAYCQLVALWTCRAARSFFKTLAVSQLLSRPYVPANRIILTGYSHGVHSSQYVASKLRIM